MPDRCTGRGLEPARRRPGAKRVGGSCTSSRPVCNPVPQICYIWPCDARPRQHGDARARHRRRQRRRRLCSASNSRSASCCRSCGSSCSAARPALRPPGRDLLHLPHPAEGGLRRLRQRFREPPSRLCLLLPLGSGRPCKETFVRQCCRPPRMAIASSPSSAPRTSSAPARTPSARCARRPSSPAATTPTSSAASGF